MVINNNFIWLHVDIFSTLNQNFLTHLPLVLHIYVWMGSALVQIMACRLFGAKPLSKPMLGYCQLEIWNRSQWNFYQNTKLSIHKNTSANTVCEMEVILSRKDELIYSKMGGCNNPKLVTRSTCLITSQFILILQFSSRWFNMLEIFLMKYTHHVMYIRAHYFLISQHYESSSFQELINISIGHQGLNAQ